MVLVYSRDSVYSLYHKDNTMAGRKDRFDNVNSKVLLKKNIILKINRLVFLKVYLSTKNSNGSSRYNI